MRGLAPNAYAEERTSTTPAASHLAELLAKRPELAAYTYPATAGDVREVIAKLDEIAVLLGRLVSASARR